MTKLAILLIIGAVFQATAGSFAQNITLNVRRIPLSEAMESIRQQSGYLFLLKGKELADTKVSAHIKDATLGDVMNALLKDYSLDWVVKGKTIVVTQRPVQKSSNPVTLSVADRNTVRQAEVRGRVVDESDNPVEGVTVAIKGTSRATTSNSDGSYQLTVEGGGSVLVFTAIGFQSQEIPVAGQSVINITLRASVSDLDEVVVVGYGTQRRSDVTGSIASVSTAQTQDIPNYNIVQSLQGRAPGLNVVSPDRPGENPALRIRGINSLSAGTSPLIVVDGIIYNGSLSDFNVNDIESVDILKDASAAAVYGSRSANGVIILTTKMGKTNKPTFNFNGYYGVSDPVHVVPVLDGQGYLKKILDFRDAVGLEADPAKIEDYLSVTETENYRNGKTIDWYDKIIKTGETQNYNLNVSGKTDRTNYYLSGTYYTQEGIVANDDFERVALRANFTNQITDWFSVSLKTSFSSLDYSGVEAGLYYGLSPYGAYWEDETKGIYKEFPMEDPFFTHPLINTFVDNKDIRNSIFGLISSEVKVPFIEGLKWTLNYSSNLRGNKTNNFWDNTHVDGKTRNGLARKTLIEDYDWTFDNIINYRRDFAGVHSADVTLLYSRQYRRFERTFAEASDFFNQALGYNGLGLGVVQQTESNYENENSVAYMARINYVYNDKYSLTATVRKDGFSGFAENNKYATFPSIAFAWTASNEGFMNGISALSLLKVRLSYGVNGNQALGRYQTLARMANNQYVFGDGEGTIPTVYVESMANQDLGWETTKVKNIGIDFGVLENRLSGNIDIYASNTSNILLERSIPGTSGFSTIWTNIGKVHNKGIELALNTVNLQKGSLTWESGVTFALNRNRIDELLGQDLDGNGREDDDLANSWFIGKPLGVIYGYKTDGIYQLDDDIPAGFQPGDFRLADVNGDGELTADDRTILGSTLPNYTFSISNTVHYKNFSLYVLINSIQGRGNENYYVGNNMAMHNVNNQFSTWTERFNFQNVPYWTPQNPSDAYARINYIPTRPHPYLEDRSFVRLQDITISYAFPQTALSKLGLTAFRPYLSAKNLYTWTKWTGYDPENSTSIGNFPMLRTFTLGVDLRF